MACQNVKECICPKKSCPNHGKCCDCVIKHRTTDSLPFCLFPDNGGDKSNRNHYEVLKKRFGGEKKYGFYGWQTADVKPGNEKYKSIENPRMLYDMLLKIWCAETCAPRMRADWKKSHPSFGQCSITAFLAQDIFGGDVYGVLREGGNFHCYNVIGDCVFDLTSEQFGDEKLNYENNPLQSRGVHFSKEEKKLRYEDLKARLDELLKQ